MLSHDSSPTGGAKEPRLRYDEGWVKTLPYGFYGIYCFSWKISSS